VDGGYCIVRYRGLYSGSCGYGGMGVFSNYTTTYSVCKVARINPRKYSEKTALDTAPDP